MIPLGCVIIGSVTLCILAAAGTLALLVATIRARRTWE